MAKVFKRVTPPSEADSNLEQYEFMLIWFARTGEPLQYLFYDYEIDAEINTEAINVTDSNTIGNLIVSERDQVNLVAQNLTRNQLDVMRSILVSKNVYRLYKDGTSQKIAVTGRNVSYRNSRQRFNFEFTIVEPQRQLAQ